MFKTLNSFLQDTLGATSIEYSLVAVLISTAIVVALTSVSGGVTKLYNLIVSAV